MNKTWNQLSGGVLLVGVFALSGCANRPPEVTPPHGPAGPAVATTVAADAMLDLPAEGRFSELSFDAARRLLWFVVPGDPRRLMSFDVNTGRSMAYDLPAGLDTSYSDHVRVAPDGAVWLTSAYSVLRVDPATKAVLRKDLPAQFRARRPQQPQASQ